MARFIVSASSPAGRRWPAHESEIRALFGVTGGKWPAQGCPVREIQGILVHVLPADHASLLRADGKRKSRAQHRCLAACPDCGAVVSAGRLHQHKCSYVKNRAEAERRADFKATLARTRLQAQLRELELAYLDAPDDTQDQDDALNAFCEAAGNAMDRVQRYEWDCWCLKATQDEIVSEALRILGMQQVERKHEQA